MGCSGCLSRGHDESKINTKKTNIYIDSCSKLGIFDWLQDINLPASSYKYVEVRFKNTRKCFYHNVNKLRLKQGDIVAVEASPGHDIGIVSLTGELVINQMDKLGVPQNDDVKKIYRIAKQNDIEKWKQAMELENITMLKSRQIAKELNLAMKIGDVEYQGDKTKAIFYYIADERVDFRELIKKLAEEFKIRIEMKQIGARQEAGRIGGIGTCGRELCCTTWMSNFISVTTGSARYQEISLNPQKLAGQCSKLKCCLNYEVDVYLDAQQNFPNKDIPLYSEEGTAYHTKTDVFKGIMWYSFDKEYAVNLTPVPVERVKEIIKLNKDNKKVEKLVEVTPEEEIGLDFQSSVGEGSLTRFEEKKQRPKKKKNRNRKNKKRPQNVQKK